MTAFLHLVALAGYLGAWALSFRAFRTGGGRGEDLGWKLGVGAAGVHVVALGAFTLEQGVLPLVGLGPASSTLALAIALLTLVASAREEVRPTVLFVLPLTVLLLAEAVAVGIRPVQPRTDFRGAWLAAHVGVLFVGYAGLSLASAAAAMYALQFRALKRKRFGSVFSYFPSLDTLDRLNRVGLWIGFSGLTLGLLAGWGRTLTYGQGWELGNPQVVFGVATWVAYLGAILVRVAPGGRGERSALATTVAFVVTVAVFALLRATAESAGFFL